VNKRHVSIVDLAEGSRVSLPGKLYQTLLVSVQAGAPAHSEASFGYPDG
jgi:hypothetical protein